MTASQRPKGVTILAWLAIISAFSNLITAFLEYFQSKESNDPGMMLSALFAILLAFLGFYFGIGALNLKPWAWGFGIGLYIVHIIIDVSWLSNPDTLPSGIVGLVFDSLILYYLFTLSVKRAFGKA